MNFIREYTTYTATCITRGKHQQKIVLVPSRASEPQTKILRGCKPLSNLPYRYHVSMPTAE